MCTETPDMAAQKYAARIASGDSVRLPLMGPLAAWISLYLWLRKFSPSRPARACLRQPKTPWLAHIALVCVTRLSHVNGDDAAPWAITGSHQYQSRQYSNVHP